MNNTNTVVKCAKYFTKHNSTVRKTADHFGMSKSTVHKYLTVDIKTCDKELYKAAKKLLKKNKKERALRGGLATKKKYAKLKRTNKKVNKKNNKKA